MADNYNLAFWVAGWMVVVVVILYSQWKSESVGVGLVLAYVMNLWLIHWPAVAVYLFPWYSNFDPGDVVDGFKESTYAIIAFGVGSVIIAPFLMRLLRFPLSKKHSMPILQLPSVYIVMGLVCYLILLPIFGGLPTVTALISGGWNLLTVGMALKCWHAWQRRRKSVFLKWIILAMCLPFLTIITNGFMGYGTVIMLSVFAFVTSFYRPRWKLIGAGFLVGYMVLSIYVTYMRDRNDIRAVVWGNQSLDARAERMYLTFSNLELFDPTDNSHLQRIDERLNQSYLVGVAKHQLDTGNRSFAAGETLWEAVIALVPRVIWPDKPVTAGSGNLVSKYTDIIFESSTSVGIGQVMEFYVNFGTAGVVFGFLILGIVITTIDRGARERLTEGDWQGFAFWFLPGLSFLQAGGSLVEVTSSAGASVVLAFLVKRFIVPRLRSARVQPVPINFQLTLPASQQRYLNGRQSF